MANLKSWFLKTSDFEKLRMLVLGLFVVALVWNLSTYVVLPGRLPKDFSLDLAAQDLVVFSKYDRGQVLEVLSAEQGASGQYAFLLPQKVKVRMDSGDQAGQTIEVDHQTRPGDPGSQLKTGGRVVLGFYQIPGESNYVVIDRFRLPALAWLMFLFGVIVVAVAKWRGFASLVAMLFSLGVLYFGIAPNILVGREPILVTIIGAAVVLTVSIFLSHGFSKKTLLAFWATVLSMLLAIGLAEIAVAVTKVFGSGDSDALFLQSGLMGALNLRGLFLAGVIIGTLGILDDVTSTQVSSVKELSESDRAASVKQLFFRAMRIGKDHIAAIVNTLVFAYAGVAMPLFLLVLVNVSQPVWVMVNSEPIAEELVRMLVGSATLVLAVPLSTILAASWYGKNRQVEQEAGESVVVVEETVVVVEE